MSTRSNNGSFFGLLGPPRLLLVCLLLQVLVISTLPTTTTTTPPPPVSLDADDGLTRRAEPYPEFPSHYQGRVEKGRYLLDLMSVDNAGAAQRNGGASVVSPFQNFKDLTRWGWSRHILRYPYTDSRPGSLQAPFYEDFLDDAFQDPDHPVLKRQMLVVAYWHDQWFYGKDSLEKVMPSFGHYDNVAAPISGAFVFDQNWSPRYQQKKYKKGNVPELDHLSDIAFFEWVEACQDRGSNPKELKLMFRSHITYVPTLKVLQKALRDKGLKKYPFWKKRAVFKTDTPEAAAILGSTHGAGAAWMLIQHKDALGVKKITDIAVWAYKKKSSLFSGGGCSFDEDPDDCIVNIRFIVEDA
ncbi:hypothetical protein Cob_v001701 [Colletotrichum orbiculare MAFF 240422]|uniref:Uncharacterized protein n=1 Tax=Colletotrichum orbiculare (strain 104-T / ATCC 96160 / CBS 514.97 / LARS 414 / MAFF 240422) TaxID=1213857 RepID=N4UW73_COLOR|nr:hypothetical protein Cob_v001701 [Colletotrichum orbiculare MAFF 240422]